METRTRARTAHLERRLVWSPRRALLSSLLVLALLFLFLFFVPELTASVVL